MRYRLLLLTCFVALTTAIATSQTPLAGLTKLQAEGVGTGGSSTASGTLTGDPMGMATWTYVNESSGTNTTNGQGGNCATTAGHITITAADGSAINMRHAGTSCNTAGATGGAVNVVGYVITGGTGRFSNAAGTGNVIEGAVNGAGGETFIHFDGNIDFH